MSIAFWSVSLKAGAAEVTIQPPEGFVLNLMGAALSATDKGAYVVHVTTKSIEGDDLDAVICTLRGDRVEQCQLCKFLVNYLP